MDEKLKETKTFFQKIKSIKHFEIIVAVLFCAVLLIIYISTLKTSSKSTSTTEVTSYTTEEYSKYLENKLEKVLSQISGAGSVHAMVTLSCGVEYIYATESEDVTNTNSGSSSSSQKVTSTDSIVLVTSSGKTSPIIVKQILPQVSGIIIVSQGAGNVSVKLELLKAIQALLNVPTANIEILVGK